MVYLIYVIQKFMFLPLLYMSPLFLTTTSVGFGFDKAIGLIKVKGTITEEVEKETTKNLRKYRRNKNIKAIVLRIDSPGGGVAASQEIYNEIKRVRNVGKPVFASMGSIAASGGYYIAIPCDKIYANPGTMTGSIGVIMEMFNVEELMEKIGIYSMVIKSKEHKDIGSPFREMTEKEKKLLKSLIDDVYNQFTDAIVLERGLKKEDVLRIADGRILTGKQAVELGLVDELGDMEDAITSVAKEVGIKGKPKVLTPKKKRPTLLQILGLTSLIEEYIKPLQLEYR